MRLPLISTHCLQDFDTDHLFANLAAYHQGITRGSWGWHTSSTFGPVAGWASSFGYEAHKFDVSMKVGERHLLPAVRSAPEAVIIADGFSCRSQIKHGAGREALHTAQALALALREGT